MITLLEHGQIEQVFNMAYDESQLRNRDKMRSARLEKWEGRLKEIFNRIDDYLEEKYGHLYRLHPVRPHRGATSSKEHDGLFNVGSSFSAGFGSEYGPGYVVEVRFATLSKVPRQIREQIEEEVAQILRKELPGHFPGKKLKVVRDGRVYKIYGDLSLGKL